MKKKFHLRRRLKHEYGLSEEDYNNLHVQQNNQCKICGITPKKLVVDHCHTTGRVRGLLCHNCNTGLGQFKDNTQFLQLAIKYLNDSK